MIVLAARLMGSLSGRQIVLSMHQKKKKKKNLNPNPNPNPKPNPKQGELARRQGRLFLI